eukprot:941030-Rhodomonas_salina.2
MRKSGLIVVPNGASCGRRAACAYAASRTMPCRSWTTSCPTTMPCLATAWWLPVGTVTTSAGRGCLLLPGYLVLTPGTRTRTERGPCSPKQYTSAQYKVVPWRESCILSARVQGVFRVWYWLSDPNLGSKLLRAGNDVAQCVVRGGVQEEKLCVENHHHHHPMIIQKECEFSDLYFNLANWDPQ